MRGNPKEFAEALGEAETVMRSRKPAGNQKLADDARGGLVLYFE